MTEPNYFYRFCCNVPGWVVAQATNPDDPADDFKSICPCPYITPVYRSASQLKKIAGIANVTNNRFYKTKISTGYVTEFSTFWQRWLTLDITTDLLRTDTAVCENDGTTNINSSYEGSANVTADNVIECEVSYTAPDGTEFYEKSVVNANTTADWEGGSEFCTPDRSVEADNWSYAENCDPGDDWDFDFKLSPCIYVDSDYITNEFSDCPDYCNVGDETNGTSGISFIPCGASTLGGSNTGTKTSVKYAVIFKNLRVDESYQGYARVQYRIYLANYGISETPGAEDNWFEDNAIEITPFTADKTYKIIGGNLNVPVADFEAQNLSTSIYSYPDNFYDPSTEEWDTDGQVIIANQDLDEVSGYQYRIKEFWVRRSSDPECEAE